MKYSAKCSYLVLLLMLFFSYNVYAMGKRIITYDKEYEENGKIYVNDRVYYDKLYWWRSNIEVTNYQSLPGYPPHTYYFDELLVCHMPAPVELPVIYERPELLFYCDTYDLITGDISIERYSRRNGKEIILAYKKMEKSYTRLGTFTFSDKKPLGGQEVQWDQAKEQILACATGKFAPDAVIIEGWDEVEFEQKDYWPITKFQYPTYIRFNCVAVAFKETAEIPKYLKVIVLYEDVDYPYEELGDFTIEFSSDEKWFTHKKEISKKAYDLYKPDGAIFKKEEIISKGNIFVKGKKRYTFTAVKFDEQTKQKYIVNPYKKKYGLQ